MMTFQAFYNSNIVDYLSVKELQLLTKEFNVKELKTGDTLLKRRKVCSHICFLASGSFYQYRFDAYRHKDVFGLYIENDWILDAQSFISRRPSEYTIEAYENSLVYELSIDSIYKLIGMSQSYLKLVRLLEDKTSRIRINEKYKSPDQKYKYILNERPQLLQKFPQTMIASYLQMTPETLSRVRKRLVKKAC